MGSDSVGIYRIRGMGNDEHRNGGQVMKWNSEGKKWQQSREGTARAHKYYFITKHGTGKDKWQAGYYGFGKQVVMTSAGLFDTAREARAYCEKIDREAVIIEAVTA